MRKITSKFFDYLGRGEGKLELCLEALPSKSRKHRSYFKDINSVNLFSFLGFVYRAKLLCDILQNLFNLQYLFCQKTPVNDGTIV